MHFTKRAKHLFAIASLTAHLVGCSPTEWAKAGDTVQAVVDQAALTRADQIRGKATTAEAAALSGDSFAAMKALAEAQALIAAELARRPAVCPAPTPSAP